MAEHRRAAVLAGVPAALVVTAWALLIGVPWVTDPREQAASIPTPLARSLVGLARVPPGEEACTTPVVVDPRSEVAAFRAGTFGRPGPPLTVRVTGAGYRVSAVVAGGYGDDAVQRVALRPPTRPTVVKVCIGNAGSREVALYAVADDQSLSRSVTTVAGETVPDISLAFVERRPVSLWTRLPTSVRRLSTFRADVVVPALVWVLLALVAFAVPVLAIAAAAFGSREDARGPDRRGQAPAGAASAVRSSTS